MKTIYAKSKFKTMLLFLFLSLTSCSPDTDLIAEGILISTDEEISSDDDSNSESEGEEEPGNNYSVPEGSYFVTVNGDSNNDGLSEENAWDIEYAFQNAGAGDYVFIKSGNYGSVELQVKNAGHSGAPIRFIGYKDTPGDITASNGSTFNYGDSLDENEMPLLIGQRENDRGQGTAIFSFTSYIEFSNIQITHYKNGIFASGHHNVLDNIIVTEVGNFDPSMAYPYNGGLSNYEGRGINVDGDYSIIKNCFVLNAGAEGFRFKGCEFQKHSFNKVYSDSTVNGCDYYYLLLEEANNNEVENIYVERVGGVRHLGHGLILKFQATGNILRGCTIKNTWFEFSYSGVMNNEIINCSAIGGAEKEGNLLIANGANNNLFRNCVVANNDGVCFSDWDEDFSRGDVENAGNNNTFFQCEFRDMSAGINYWWWSQEKREIPAHENVFDDCKFINLDKLFLIDRENYGNVIRNSTIENVKEYKGHTYPSRNSNIVLNMIYESNTLVNCGFDIEQ